MSKIKMFWWNEQPNFGDALNPIIIKKLFGITAEWADLHEAQLVGAGSCMQWVAKAVDEKPHEMHIWGTGYIFDQEPPVANPNVQHHAVRGVVSKKFGNLDSVVLGDPGLLSPLLFDKPVVKKYRVGIVPHLWNRDDLSLRHIADPDVIIIDVSGPALKVVEEIASCEFIYSSSLHGLIVADSFGIPNQWVQFSEKLFGGEWKFNDYYSVFDIATQNPTPFEPSLVKSIRTDEIVSRFESRKEISNIQNSLISVFPKVLAR